MMAWYKSSWKIFFLNSSPYCPDFTKNVGNKDPKAFPILFAILAQVVANALPESENQVIASNELEFKKKGCPSPANVFPSMKKYGV